MLPNPLTDKTHNSGPANYCSHDAGISRKVE